MTASFPSAAPTAAPILVSPTALVLSLLHAGGVRLPLVMARHAEDFWRRSARLALIERGCLGELDLRRLALRRAFTATPRLVLVLGRDQEPTARERAAFDQIFVADGRFSHSVWQLRRLVDATPPPLPGRIAVLPAPVEGDRLAPLWARAAALSPSLRRFTQPAARRVAKSLPPLHLRAPALTPISALIAPAPPSAALLPARVA